MNRREQLIKSISNEFALWQVRLENLGSINLFDAHNISEDSICKLLNLVFDYKLENLNRLKMNFPAVDLGDNYNSVCFQVTSEKTSRKIQATLDKFLELNLHSQYQDLFVIILGRKQDTYKVFTYSEKLNFTPEHNILDFRDLLRQVRSYPITKLEAILSTLTREREIKHAATTSVSNSARIKRNLSLKKKLQKEFLRPPSEYDWEFSRYEPWIKFTHNEVLIRSVDDTKWPEPDYRPGEISSWFKVEIWDFYNNGIELIGMGGQAIFDEDDNWDILDYKGDERRQKEEYRIITYYDFLRIPYDFIEILDMDTDPYQGLPSIYVRYANDGMPYECIVQGILGSHSQKQYRWLFDLDKRKKLK